MDISGKFKLDESKNLNNKSSIVVNHEQIRLNTKINDLKSLLLQRDNELLNIIEDKNSIDRQLSLLGNRYTEILEETQILNDRNNRDKGLSNRYKLDLDKVQANSNKYKELYNKKKEEIKEMKLEKKVLFDEKADLLATKKELTDSGEIVLRSSINERMKVKKQVILPSNLNSFQREINNILNEEKVYYTNWVNIFINNWNGDSSNIFSLSSNRSIEILKRFGYTENFIKNDIPFKKITEPLNGWVLSDTDSIDYLVKDYNTLSNVLPKSCPGCDDFVLDTKIDISLKNLFNAVYKCTPNNSSSNIQNQQLIINSNYSNYKYWSNCKEIIDKCVVCSNNIVELNNKLSNIDRLNDIISTSFDNIYDILKEYLLIETDYDQIKKLRNELSDEVVKIYNIISTNFFEINKCDYNRDNLFVQVDTVSNIDKNKVIQWIRQVPLVYNDPITGPLVFNPKSGIFREYNPVKYLIANDSGNLDEDNDEQTYQLAGQEGHIFKLKVPVDGFLACEIKEIKSLLGQKCPDILTLFDSFYINNDKTLSKSIGIEGETPLNSKIIHEQSSNVPINNRWEIIKTTEDLQDNIINNKDQLDISKICLYFQNIISLNTKLHKLFVCELDN